MLNGKVALVTGGSRGLGKAIALKLAELGADVAIIYASNTARAEETLGELRQKGVRALSLACDVSDFNAAKEAVAEVGKALGTVDILVNNSGITKDGLLVMMKEENFDAVLDTNLKGTFNMIRHCSPGFIKKRSGKIINISSVSGIIGNAGQANYSASKAGIIGLTKAVARELSGRNVCCNAVAPGFIQTEMTESIDEKNPLLLNIPMGRMGKPEDVAELVAFLAGDASNYITGEVIRVDGGLAI